MVKKAKRQQEEEKPVPLRTLRDSVGLSQVKLAARLGVDPATISRCERGLIEPVLTVKQLKALAEIAGFTSVSELPDYLGKPPLSSLDQN